MYRYPSTGTGISRKYKENDVGGAEKGNWRSNFQDSTMQNLAQHCTWLLTGIPKEV
jgi:hypothetical protein